MYEICGDTIAKKNKISTEGHSLTLGKPHTMERDKNDNDLPRSSKMKSTFCSENDNCWTVPMEEEKQDEDKSQICCFAGCLTGIAAGFLFIFIVPLGFLFVVYGRNNDSPLFLVAGVMFLILPLLIFGGFVMIVQCRRQIQAATKAQNTSIKQNNQSQRY